MNIITRLFRGIRDMFINSADIGKKFGVDIITSSGMTRALKLWDTVSTGRPPWVSPDDDIKSINMAKHISDYRARLTTLDIGIAVSGSPRANYLQGIVDRLLQRLPEQVANADRLGGMMIKFNGDTWDFILPGDFGITAVDNDSVITGAIFATHKAVGNNKYTRLEYHRFDGDLYHVSNKAFRNTTNAADQTMLGTEVPLTEVAEWADIVPEAEIANLDHPLFAYYRVPGANVIDKKSPLGASVFSDAIEVLKSIDIGVSRKDIEVEDSKHITFVGQTLVKTSRNKGIELPRFVRGLGMGINDNETTNIHEHNPTLQTDSRIKDLNFNLSLAGVLCGFSEGVFVLDGQSGVITATQVESDDRDTIQTIKDERDALQRALEVAIYGADALVTLYGLAPLGAYELNFNFGDITYNVDEDRMRWWQYVTNGKIPFWYYLVKFEGFSEEGAKALNAEAEATLLEKATLFGGE